MANLLLTGIHGLHAAALCGAWLRFDRAAADPGRAQASWLRNVIQENASSDYGRRHRFDSIDSVRAYQDRIPIVDYDALEPWIDRIAAGEQGVLTDAPVAMMERSGGATATNKLVPYTDGLRGDFSAMTGAWLFNLYRHRRALWRTRSYWSVSPVAQASQKTEGGLPIGFEDDTEYFGRLQRWAIGRIMAVPAQVAKVRSIARWRRESVRYLLAAADLGLISVWSPTFMNLLMEEIAANLSSLVAWLPPERRAQIESRVDAAGRVTGEALWPDLSLLSCWTDGPAVEGLAALRRWFPETDIQGKGLLATEGAVSFPLSGHGGAALAVTSHFLEFIDLDRPGVRPLLCHELREGGRYSPLLTTRGGFYRYHLKDAIRCVGRYRSVPCVRFECKLDRVSDLCGEKINARQVWDALMRARKEVGLQHAFAMLAPVRGEPPHYCLFVESDAPGPALARAAAIVEEYLATGHHYRYCRDLGQLGPLRCERVVRGASIYQQRLIADGQRAGDIKPTCLDTRHDWRETFAAENALIAAAPSSHSALPGC